jgi:hypothetical protein
MDWQMNGSLFAECPSGVACSMTAEAMGYPCRDLGPYPLKDSFLGLHVHGPWDFESHAVSSAGPSDRNYES